MIDSLKLFSLFYICLIIPILTGLLGDFSRMLLKKNWKILAGDWRSGVALVLTDRLIRAYGWVSFNEHKACDIYGFFKKAGFSYKSNIISLE